MSKLSINFWSRIYIWHGWLTGLILLDSPAGLPSLTSFIGWHTFCSVIGAILNHLTFLSTLMRIIQKNTSLPGRIDMKVTAMQSLSVIFGLIMIWKRLYVWCRAKYIARFLRDLDDYEFFEKSWKAKLNSRNTWHSIFGIGYILLKLIIICSHEIHYFQQPNYGNNFLIVLTYWVLTPLSFWSKCVIFTASYVILGLIITVTSKLLFILEDFCDHLEFCADLESPICQADERKLKLSPDGIDDKIMKRITEDCFIKEFDKVKGLFESYENIFGPLYLTMFLASFFGILHGMNDILVEYKPPLLLVYEILKIILDLHIIMLLELGHKVHTCFRHRKQRLNYLLETNIERLASSPTNLAIRIFLQWDWRLTASDFFEVDRHLVAGLTTATMTYAVILLQLNDKDSSDNRNVTRVNDGPNTSPSDTTKP